MRKDIGIASVRASVHAHSTESEAAVRAVLSPFIVQGEPGEDPVARVTLDGDAGNRITVMTFMTRKKREIDRFLDGLAAVLPDEHKHVLGRHFMEFFNPATKSVYLRLQKQALHQGHACISREDDVVHVTIKISTYQKQDTSPGYDTTGIEAVLRARGIIT